MTLVAVLYDDNNSECEYIDNVGNFNKYYTTQSYAMVLLEDNKYIIDCLTDNKPGSIQTQYCEGYLAQLA